MKKKRIALVFGATCVLFTMLVSVVAFAGDYDTPTIPICTNHRYVYETITEATCTENGKRKGTCSKCSKTKTETISAYGHLFMFSGTQTYEGATLHCRDCDESRVFSAEELESLWSEEFINTAPHRTVDNSNSSYLDLDANNIINAKDYAMIVKLANNEQKLIETQNNSNPENNINEP